MNFSNVKSFTISEGTVKKLEINGVEMWKSAPEKYSWEGVLDSISKGTYSTDYGIGELIPLDLGAEGIINMQIAAFDSDILADESGNAHITFVAKNPLATKHRMNPEVSPASAPYTEGTGAIGGWEKSELRSYLNGTIKPLIPANVRSSLKSVKKMSATNSTAGTYGSQTTYDDLWIPSKGEVKGGYDKEPNMPVYSSLFAANDDNTRRRDGVPNGQFWWLRGTFWDQVTNFDDVAAWGTVSSSHSQYLLYIIIGFCL